MGRKQMDDLAEFAEWLRDDLFMSKSTTSTYTSRVRHLLANVNPVTSEALYAYASSPAQVRSLAPTIAGWSHFVKFGAKKGVEIPPLLAAPEPFVPHPLSLTLRQLWKGYEAFSKIDETILVNFRNRDLTTFYASLRGYEVTYGGTTYTVSKKNVDEVRAWSGNGDNPDAPFIPAEPGSLAAMTAANLRRHARY